MNPRIRNRSSVQEPIGLQERLDALPISPTHVASHIQIIITVNDLPPPSDLSSCHILPLVPQRVAGGKPSAFEVSPCFAYPQFGGITDRVRLA